MRAANAARLPGTTLLGIRALSSRADASFAEVPHLDVWWCDVWSAHEDERLYSSIDGQYVARNHSQTCAALAGPEVLKRGSHEITISAAGAGLVVGIAEAACTSLASPWMKRSWGVATWNQKVLCCPTTLDLSTGAAADATSRALNQEEAPQLLVTLRVDTVRRTVEFVCNGERVGTITRVPTELRPWVLFVPRDRNSDGDAVRLVSHAFSSVPVFRVAGLSDLVGNLSEIKQALALSWCESHDVCDITQLRRGPHGDALHFIGALGLQQEQVDELLQRLDEMEPPQL